jgi:hypothetical protein
MKLQWDEQARDIHVLEREAYTAAVRRAGDVWFGAIYVCGRVVGATKQEPSVEAAKGAAVRALVAYLMRLLDEAAELEAEYGTQEVV